MAVRFTKLQNVDLDDTTGTEGEEEGDGGGRKEEGGMVRLIPEEQPNGEPMFNCDSKRRWRWWWSFKHRIKRNRVGRCCWVNSWRTVLIAFVVFFATVVISLLVSRLAKEPTREETFLLTQGAVATDVPRCSEMAASILERNGSAVDAAITALLCVGVVHAESSGIGGGGFMVVYDTNGSAHAVNFRETAPSAATTDMYHSNKTLAELGGLAVGIPGELRGMEVAHNMFGRLAWHELFEPVINMCRIGFPLTKHTEAALNENMYFLVESDQFRRAYFNESGEPKKAGDIVQRPELADTLEAIAQNGTAEFYNGSIAQSIVDEVHRAEGILTLEDLASYEARLERPISINYSDYTVYSAAAPSGGPLLLFFLNTLDTYSLLPADSTHNLTYHRLVEVFKYGFALRTQLGDPSCDNCTTIRRQVLDTQTTMISDAYAEAIHQNISDKRTFDVPHYHAHYSTPGDHGTTHVSVLAPDGQAVSVTSTINTYFGSKLMTSTGIVLNNEMDDFSSPNITNFFGVRPSETNFILPGKRPLSSTCPTIVVKSKGGATHPHLIIGGSGGTRIPTATAQAALRVLSFRESVTDAIEGRRLHHQLTPNVVFYEDGYPEGILEFLHKKGHEVNATHSYAVVQGIHVDTSGNVTAHSDSRKQGQSVIV